MQKIILISAFLFLKPTDSSLLVKEHWSQEIQRRGRRKETIEAFSNLPQKMSAANQR